MEKQLKRKEMKVIKGQPPEHKYYAANRIQSARQVESRNTAKIISDAEESECFCCMLCYKCCQYFLQIFTNPNKNEKVMKVREENRNIQMKQMKLRVTQPESTQKEMKMPRKTEPYAKKKTTKLKDKEASLVHLTREIERKLRASRMLQECILQETQRKRQNRIGKEQMRQMKGQMGRIKLGKMQAEPIDKRKGGVGKTAGNKEEWKRAMQLQGSSRKVKNKKITRQTSPESQNKKRNKKQDPNMKVFPCLICRKLCQTKDEVNEHVLSAHSKGNKETLKSKGHKKPAATNVDNEWRKVATHTPIVSFSKFPLRQSVREMRQNVSFPIPQTELLASPIMDVSEMQQNESIIQFEDNKNNHRKTSHISLNKAMVEELEPPIHKTTEELDDQKEYNFPKMSVFCGKCNNAFIDVRSLIKENLISTIVRYGDVRRMIYKCRACDKKNDIKFQMIEHIYDHCNRCEFVCEKCIPAVNYNSSKLH